MSDSWFWHEIEPQVGLALSVLRILPPPLHPTPDSHVHSLKKKKNCQWFSALNGISDWDKLGRAEGRGGVRWHSPRIVAVAAWWTLRETPLSRARNAGNLSPSGRRVQIYRTSQTTRVPLSVNLANSLKFPYLQNGDKITVTELVWKRSVAWPCVCCVNCKSQRDPRIAVLLVSCGRWMEECGGWEQPEEASGLSVGRTRRTD